MLRWAIVCFVLSLLAGILGFTEVSADLAGIGKILFFLFLVFFLVFVVAGIVMGKKIAGKLTFLLAALTGGAWVSVAHAVDKAPVPDSLALAPGHYATTIVPEINKAMAERLKKSVDAVAGVDEVEVRVSDAVIYFTVQEGTEVRPSEIQKAIVKVDPKAVMATPILKGSMSANPGL